MNMINVLNRLKKKSIGVLLLSANIFFSCEKVIDPSLQNANPVLVVEAWINDKSEKQTVQLTMTQPYFDSSTPVGVSGATVILTDDLNTTFSFADDGSNTGTYQWVPTVGETIGSVGRKYKLTVQVNGETFESTSQMNRTTPVDSITFIVQPDLQYPEGSYIGQFWATDPQGPGDVYWIRTFKNGISLNKPSELNIAYDAGFSAGGDFDGATFIPPIRQAINPIDKDPKNDNKLLPPYVPGDSVYVEIQSITLEAFNHLQQVAVQTQRNGGFGELFSKPLANVSCNIFNTNPKGSQVVGFFNVSAVKGLGKKFVQ
jgi:hypothetical protein